jgi:Trk K+ transport system NAD-binding subunit
MSFFDAFYFMSYTATTIGFGEIPYALTTEQRMWVTLSIYVAVIGWAYAIGTLLALLQDRSFRRELATLRFARQVRRMPEPFLIVVGYGEAGARVVGALDRRGRRMVVLDRSQERIDAVELAALRSDVPALAANGRQPTALQLAGLTHPRCAGVLALTDDDEANLAAVQAAHLLRPGLPVIARAASASTGQRMLALGAPTVVDPFDAFGDRLRLILRSPALAQLFEWLVSPPGAILPPQVRPPADGRWVVVGHSRTVSEVVADLRGSGLEVSVLDPEAAGRGGAGPGEVLTAGTLDGAVALLAAADRDTVNVDAVAAARRIRPQTFVVARQESPANAALFAALHPDLLLVPAEVVAREVLERLANPALWDFLTAARERDEAWAAQVRDDLVATSGPGSPYVWQVRLDADHAPALVRRMEAGEGPVRLGDLLLSPFGRAERLPL